MESTSIKEVSVADLERSLAEVLQKFTNKEWNVSIGEVKHDEKVLPFSSSPIESFRLSLQAKTAPIYDGDMPF